MDEALTVAVDEFIAADPAARERLVNVSLDVECVRAVLDAETWLLFRNVSPEPVLTGRSRRGRGQ